MNDSYSFSYETVTSCVAAFETSTGEVVSSFYGRSSHSRTLNNYGPVFPQNDRFRPCSSPTVIRYTSNVRTRNNNLQTKPSIVTASWHPDKL